MASQESAVQQLESSMGRTLDIDHVFYQWNQAFPTWRQAWDEQSGRTPMISWARYPASAINSGSQDQWIKSEADAVRNFRAPILLRWFSQMEANAPEAGTTSTFIAAWRHIHDIFDQEGATNARFVWCPNAFSFASGSAQSFYPGDAYVDWICADGYNWSPVTPGGKPGGRWTSFQSIFNAFYQWGSTRGKPLMVGETGVQEGASGQKAQWLADMGTAMSTQFPGIKALVYQDSITSTSGGAIDWRVNSSASAIAAFSRLVHEPFMHSPTPPAG
jgi:beta-mannanase